MSKRKRSHRTKAESRVAPPFMHDSDLAEDLEILLREFELERFALVTTGFREDDPEMLGIDAKLDACRTTLIAVRVALIAIDRARGRGSLQG